MATIKNFVDIEAWQEARELCILIYKFIQKEGFSKDYRLKEQINGSSGSVMDNIAEGFERGGNTEFMNFLRYAKGSSGETKSQLYRAMDRNYISAEEFENAIQLTRSISAKIQNLINYLSKSVMTGANYKHKSKNIENNDTAPKP